MIHYTVRGADLSMRMRETLIINCAKLTTKRSLLLNCLKIMAVNNGRPLSTSSLRIAALTGSMESAEAFDVGDTKVQRYGLLMKKPFGHKSGRWQKRCVSVFMN